MYKVYRVEQIIEGRKNPKLIAYYWSSIEFIRTALEHNMKNKGIINIYHKTGKKILASFEG